MKRVAATNRFLSQLMLIFEFALFQPILMITLTACISQEEAGNVTGYKVLASIAFVLAIVWKVLINTLSNISIVFPEQNL